MTYQIDILNPKASKLLKDLADMQLITISEMSPSDPFLTVVSRLRKKASHLITGDSDLLVLNKISKAEILTITSYLTKA